MHVKQRIIGKNYVEDKPLLVLHFSIVSVFQPPFFHLIEILIIACPSPQNTQVDSISHGGRAGLNSSSPQTAFFLTSSLGMQRNHKIP